MKINKGYEKKHPRRKKESYGLGDVASLDSRLSIAANSLAQTAFLVKIRLEAGRGTKIGQREGERDFTKNSKKKKRFYESLS